MKDNIIQHQVDHIVETFNFTNEQFDIFNKLDYDIKETIYNNKASIRLLSGAAGTGKTYLLSHLIEYLSLSYSVTVTAPTHKALSVIEQSFLDIKKSSIKFKTIHSFLNIKLIRDFTTGIESFKVDNYKSIVNTDILVIDESSMIGEELFRYIKDALDENKVKFILFVGDMYQLPPVENSENILFSSSIKEYKLIEIVRQAKDSSIINIATKLRELIKNKQKISIEDIFSQQKHMEVEYFYDKEDFHNNFCKNNNWAEENKIITSFTNKSVDEHNDIIRNRYWMEQQKREHAFFFVGERLTIQAGYRTNKDEILLNNQEIVLAYVKKEFLEDIGTYIWVCKDKEQNLIYIVDPQSQIIHQNFLDDIVQKINTSPQIKRKEMWEDFFNFKYSFASVKYPYASTIHKLQGSTFETIYIDLVEIINSSNHLSSEQLYRLLYVAITRASKELKILLPISVSDEITILKENLKRMI